MLGGPNVGAKLSHTEQPTPELAETSRDRPYLGEGLGPARRPDGWALGEITTPPKQRT